MKTTHQHFSGDCLEIVPGIRKNVNLVIADPPYSKLELINDSIDVCRSICSGASFFFMYAEDIFDLRHRPDIVLFWMKPASTKNTTRKYSRFVEVICVYDLHESPFNQNTFWYARSGVFTDTVYTNESHPHAKPPGLIEKLVSVNSNKYDTVLDPFAGSRTVERVCKRMGRSSISIEIS